MWLLKKQVSQEAVSYGLRGCLRCCPHEQSAPAVNILVRKAGQTQSVSAFIFIFIFLYQN